MGTKQQELLQIEKEARELTTNLKSLHEKVGSYQNAKDELDKTNTNLAVFIKSTESLTHKSHELINTINEIGASKIFEKLDILEKKSKLNFLLTVGGVGVILVLQVFLLITK
ncbi:MAG: hypothetical protein ABIF80_03650 [Patescibacteria group bacterium]